ncbi:hypothetical protein LINPERPRIM_LOCUS12844 [Linum perenne]
MGLLFQRPKCSLRNRHVAVLKSRERSKRPPFTVIGEFLVSDRRRRFVVSGPLFVVFAAAPLESRFSFYLLFD